MTYLQTATAEKDSAKWWLLIAIGTVSFMASLDGRVANTILPVQRQALNTNVAAIEWVVTVYLLVLSGLLLTFGRLGIWAVISPSIFGDLESLLPARHRAARVRLRVDLHHDLPGVNR